VATTPILSLDKALGQINPRSRRLKRNWNRAGQTLLPAVIPPIEELGIEPVLGT